MTPIPIIVAHTGMPLLRANATSSSRAPASTTPPPQQMIGRWAFSIASSALRIWIAWPCVRGL